MAISMLRDKEGTYVVVMTQHFMSKQHAEELIQKIKKLGVEK